MSTAAPPVLNPIDTDNVPLPTLEQLPNDLDTLKRMIVELVTTLHRERLDKDALRHRVNLLLQRLYGPRTERVDPNQLLLFADALTPAPDAPDTSVPPVAADAPAVPAAPKRRCRPHGRGKLSADLPRRPLHHELSEAERICVCGGRRVDIGTDMNEQVDWQPASLFVWQHWVHKYVCHHCARNATEAAMTPAQQPPTTTSDNAVSTDAAATTSTTPPTDVPRTVPLGPAVIAAPKPPPPIAKGLPGAGLLAYLIVSKYFDHLPLHRLGVRPANRVAGARGSPSGCATPLVKVEGQEAELGADDGSTVAAAPLGVAG
jgi:transposase